MEALINTKDGKAYNNSIRRLIYHQLVCDVPVNNCGYLVNVFAKILCGKPLKNVPCPATAAQMAYELGILTTIQVVDHMLSTEKNVCLSWDATTIDGQHVNEIHLTVDRNICLLLDIRQLPGGKSSDYVTHIAAALTDAAEVFAKFKGLTVNSVLLRLKKAITSTLTDRAAVNACVTRQLQDEFDSQLVMLNCNIHLPDSIARYAKQSLLKLDHAHAIRGHCYGSEGTAANLINAISVLRFKDGKGDPCGFKNMLRSHNLPVGTFVRYVGNRIHVMFHLAGILILHWDKLKIFLETECTAGSLLKSSLIKDLTNESIMAQVWAIALIGKIFTGPWMTKFYSSEMSNLDMRPYVQLTEKQLQIWLLEPNSLFTPLTNVFGEPLEADKDDVLSALHTFICGEVELQIESLCSLIKSTLTMLQRQLEEFLLEMKRLSCEDHETNKFRPRVLIVAVEMKRVTDEDYEPNNSNSSHSCGKCA
ncbi:hypothetical protein ElyMa_006120400 [Elysia marginata]|uniref:Uncharacterized protein n=1 Tax=Elysia marginata TaxID=1093978 RepID=A0AAV4GXA4_9GAST|nr:hypothetical protein ElyMa_006120400 [Elysia marginata]